MEEALNLLVSVSSIKTLFLDTASHLGLFVWSFWSDLDLILLNQFGRSTGFACYLIPEQKQYYWDYQGQKNFRYGAIGSTAILGCHLIFF